MTKLETILKTLTIAVEPGITSAYLNKSAELLCHLLGVEPAFKGYKLGPAEFPASLCVSIDDEVIHGIPSERIIREGEVVKLDLGTIENGQYDDGATTVLVGECSAAARRLVRATEEGLEAGCSAARAGKTTMDIARAISEVAKAYDLHVVHGYGGHGIGEALHMKPHVPNELDGSPAAPLVKGMRIAIEPMFATGSAGLTYVDKDGWTVKLKNGGLAAHFERTVEIH